MRTGRLQLSFLGLWSRIYLNYNISTKYLRSVLFYVFNLVSDSHDKKIVVFVGAAGKAVLVMIWVNLLTINAVDKTTKIFSEQ